MHSTNPICLLLSANPTKEEIKPLISIQQAMKVAKDFILELHSNSFGCIQECELTPFSTYSVLATWQRSEDRSIAAISMVVDAHSGNMISFTHR